MTAAVFADMGNMVDCVDIDSAKIESLNNGIMPIYEPGLEGMVKRNVKEKRINFSTDVDSAIQESELVFICVGTPPKEEGETDLSYVEGAAKTIAANLDGYKIIVNKSTVPVGTGELVKRVINENKKNGEDFDVVSNPEFLREGQAIGDALSPDRIIIGAPSKKVAMKLLELYATIGAPVIITDVPSAELIKYASNSFLAMKISFINSIADICESAGANVIDVAKGLGLDKRIGSQFLSAGLGYGGSCFPKDVVSLIHTSKKHGVDFDLLRNVVAINESRVAKFTNRIEERFGSLEGVTIAMLGLAFKPDTDDMREAKSIEVVTQLQNKGAQIRAYDPVATENAKKIMPDITYCKSPYEAAEGASAIVIITEWREFRLLDMDRLKEVMVSPVIFDGRNLYDPERKKGIGFEYYSIGRPDVKGQIRV